MASEDAKNTRGMTNPFLRVLCGVSGAKRFVGATVYRARLSDSRSHAAKKPNPTTTNTTPAGTHIIRPASCWSSIGVRPQVRLAEPYAGYHRVCENVSKAPKTPLCTAVANTYRTAAPYPSRP